MGTPPLFSERNDIEAIITDDHIKTELPVWSRENIVQLADKILHLAGL